MAKILFKKGQSGNPAGRPKKTLEAVEAEKVCRGLAQESFAKLRELLDSDNEMVRLKAIGMILDRAYGKPKQAVDGQIEVSNTAKPAITVVFPDITAKTEKITGNEQEN